ncbi:MAG: LysR family transcriptional regulator [Cytophagales bacterium]|nr:LysR family transcriptional regulator [Cytophagales bacterium]
MGNGVSTLSIKGKIWLEVAGARFLGPGRVELLGHIQATGSISQAAQAMNMSYRKAWNLVDEMNTLAGQEVVTTKKGGKTGGGAEVTPLGLSLVAQYQQLLQQFDAFARHQSAHLSLAQPSGT